MRRLTVGVMLLALALGACGDDGSSTEPGTGTSTGGTTSIATTSPSTSGTSTGASTDASTTTGEPASTSDGGSTTGSAADCVGDGLNPLTIQEAIDAAAPGDTLTVCDGTYTVPPNDPLIISIPVTLVAQSNRGVELLRIGQEQEDADPATRSLCYTDQDDVTLDGFVITGCAECNQYSAVQVDGAPRFSFLNGTVQDVVSDGTIDGTGGYGILPFNEATDLLVDNSEFYRMRHGVTSGGGSNVVDMIVQNSLFSDHSDDAIDNHNAATGTIVRDNTIEPGPSTLPGKVAIILQGTDGFLVENNTIRDNPRGGSFAGGIRIQYDPAGPESQISGTISGNTVTADVGIGITVEAGVAGSPPDFPVDVELAGNNAVDNAADLTFKYDALDPLDDYEETVTPLPNGVLTYPPTVFTPG